MPEFLMPFGKHKGQPLAQVPTDYLIWVCRQDSDKDTQFRGVKDIRAELRRRNVALPILVLDEHAIQRAGERLKWLYELKKRPGETLNQWLLRVFAFVIKNGAESKRAQRTRRKFKHRRYEYRYTDSYRGYEWKFVTQGNDVCQRLITLFPPGVNDEELKLCQ